MKRILLILMLALAAAAPIHAQTTKHRTCSPDEVFDFVTQDVLWLSTYLHIDEIRTEFADRLLPLSPNSFTPPPPLLLKYLFGRVELALAVGLPALAADNHCIEIAGLLDHEAAVLSHLLTWQSNQPLSHYRQWARSLERRVEDLGEAFDKFLFMVEYANRDR